MRKQKQKSSKQIKHDKLYDAVWESMKNNRYTMIRDKSGRITRIHIW